VNIKCDATSEKIVAHGFSDLHLSTSATAVSSSSLVFSGMLPHPALTSLRMQTNEKYLLFSSTALSPDEYNLISSSPMVILTDKYFSANRKVGIFAEHTGIITDHDKDQDADSRYSMIGVKRMNPKSETKSRADWMSVVDYYYHQSCDDHGPYKSLSIKMIDGQNPILQSQTAADSSLSLLVPVDKSSGVFLKIDFVDCDDYVVSSVLSPTSLPFDWSRVVRVRSSRPSIINAKIINTCDDDTGKSPVFGKEEQLVCSWLLAVKPSLLSNADAKDFPDSSQCSVISVCLQSTAWCDQFTACIEYKANVENKNNAGSTSASPQLHMSGIKPSYADEPVRSVTEHSLSVFSSVLMLSIIIGLLILAYRNRVFIAFYIRSANLWKDKRKLKVDKIDQTSMKISAKTANSHTPAGDDNNDFLRRRSGLIIDDSSDDFLFTFYVSFFLGSSRPSVTPAFARRQQQQQQSGRKPSSPSTVFRRVELYSRD
jgi:hypothetical protein